MVHPVREAEMTSRSHPTLEIDSNVVSPLHPEREAEMTSRSHPTLEIDSNVVSPSHPTPAAEMEFNKTFTSHPTSGEIEVNKTSTHPTRVKDIVSRLEAQVDRMPVSARIATTKIDPTTSPFTENSLPLTEETRRILEKYPRFFLFRFGDGEGTYEIQKGVLKSLGGKPARRRRIITFGASLTGKTALARLLVLDRSLLALQKAKAPAEGQTAAPVVVIVVPYNNSVTEIVTSFEGVIANAKDPRVRVGQVRGYTTLQQQSTILSSHPEIVVAAPGRLLHMFRDNQITFAHVKTLILDDAHLLADFKEVVQYKEKGGFMSIFPKNTDRIMFSSTPDFDIQVFMDEEPLFHTYRDDSKYLDKAKYHLHVVPMIPGGSVVYETLKMVTFVLGTEYGKSVNSVLCFFPTIGEVDQFYSLMLDEGGKEEVFKIHSHLNGKEHIEASITKRLAKKQFTIIATTEGLSKTDQEVDLVVNSFPVIPSERHPMVLAKWRAQVSRVKTAGHCVTLFNLGHDLWMADELTTVLSKQGDELAPCIQAELRRRHVTTTKPQKPHHMAIQNMTSCRLEVSDKYKSYLLQLAQSGLRPIATSGEGLLCGMRALATSLNSGSYTLKEMSGEEIQQLMFDSNGAATNGYDNYLKNVCVKGKDKSLAAIELSDNLAQPANFSITELNVAVDFLFHLGLVREEVGLALIWDGEHNGFAGSVTLLGDTNKKRNVIWLCADRHGNEIPMGHYEGFGYGTGRSIKMEKWGLWSSEVASGGVSQGTSRGVSQDTSGGVSQDTSGENSAS